MRDRRGIIEAWHAGSVSILATLIRVEGSSYRQPGARLAIRNDGSYEGSVSAGCLEGEVLRKASWLTRHGAVVERYSTLFDETSEMPFGLGCGGVMEILLEPADTPEAEALFRAMESSLSGRGSSVGTWLPNESQPLVRAIFDADGSVLYATSGISGEALAAARAACLGQGSERVAGCSMEELIPPQRLVVLGAGDDAKPLVSFAAILGWNVLVADGRSQLARKDRFPQAETRVVPGTDAAALGIDARSAVVIMTHSYEQDKEFLAAVLPFRPRYVGLLGSRRRSALLLSEVAARLNWPITELCNAVRAPVGLKLGGEGPEAIALAIVAEVQACCAGRSSESGKLTAARVEHYLSEEELSPSILQTECSLGR